MTYEELEEKYQSKSAVELAKELAEIKAQLDLIDDKRKEVNRVYDYLRKGALPERMGDEDLGNMTVSGVGRISLRADMYVSVPAANKEAAFDWLRGTGHGGIVKETVHAGTLKSLMKQMLKDGVELPPEELIKTTPYEIAVLTRTK